MLTFLQHWPRTLLTLLPLLLALLHASGHLRVEVLNRLDAIIYDARLKTFMPQTLDDRVVIIDIDEQSLAEVGRWPWSRNRMADLVNDLFDRQQIAVLGMDVVFAETDESSGLRRLEQLAEKDLRDTPGFGQKLAELKPELDYDARFAAALKGRPVVLGYYLTSDRQGRKSGVLPAPAMTRDDLGGRTVRFTSWDGYGSNIPVLAEAAPHAGFFNPVVDSDGVVRSIPLVAEHDGQYYESLALAMFRQLVGMPKMEPGFPPSAYLDDSYQGLESVVLRLGDQSMAIPVDDRIAALVPYRGRGGVDGGSFRYVSAADVALGRLPAGELKDKIVLLGTTAPGLLDLRVTPVGEVYPGVETHANVIAGMLDGKVLVKPDYAVGYEFVLLTLAGLLLAIALPTLSATMAILLSVGVAGFLLFLNFWLYLQWGLVLPLATSLVMVGTAFALNMSYGYFVESRSKRELANLFGTYVPPELVDEMVKQPDKYSMQATDKELTVMFSDMRGFTHMSETMEPTQLQRLLNHVFSRLTHLIRSDKGTIDKYMGDCVMAFWGAPVETPDHAQLAVRTALAMTDAIHEINAEHQKQGLPSIGMGVGLNTGQMCVGDMGSDIRRSYTVIGDAVNLGSRLEGLCKAYTVEIVASDSTRRQTRGFVWQELDLVKVKGKDEAVAIFTPLGTEDEVSAELKEELALWGRFLAAYRSQQWGEAETMMVNLLGRQPDKPLYRLYDGRLAEKKQLPYDPDWDGSTQFETK